MQLKEYVSQLKRGEVKKMAERLGISPSFLSQLVSGKSSISPQRCILIEQETKGKVTRADLCPKDWQAIWPEYDPTKPA